jgi:hypothetical protein
MVSFEEYKAYSNKVSEEMHQYRLDIRNMKRIMTYGRPAGDKVEEDYIRRYFLGGKYDNMEGVKMWLDEFDYRRGDLKGNIYMLVGDKEESKTVFSCHTDTVHRSGVIQNVLLCPDDLVFRTDSGQCLGADDGTGIWAMWELIKAGVKGLYIFHRAEEVGGQGSGYVAETLKFFKDGHYNKCIAFDRKADKSIITHQACARCCSDEFAEDLAIKMGMGHKTDNTGSFTDSASYVDYIAECTNFSVGYYGAHSARETQDIEYLFPFRDALVKVDWEGLLIKRQPGEKEYSSTGYYGYGTKKVKPPKRVREEIDWDDWDDYYWDNQGGDADWRSKGVKGDEKEVSTISISGDMKDLPLQEDWEEPIEEDESNMSGVFDDWDQYEKWLEENDPKRQPTKQELSEDNKKKESLSSKEEPTLSQGDEDSSYLDDIAMPVEDYNWRGWFTDGFVWNDKKL